MRQVTVRKAELLRIVTANRDKHRSTYEQAFEKFKDAMRKKLELHLSDLGRGRIPPITLKIEVPEDHTDDYDQVLGMLTLEVNDNVTLSWEEYRNYVDDEWDWSRRWAANTSSYVN